MTRAHPHRQVNVHLDIVDDADVIERIEAQPSMVGYIRQLVRRDIYDERLDYAARKASELQADNAKLREMASLVSEYISYDRCEGCVIKTACNSHELDECWMTTKLRNQLRDLGVEVDDD